MAKQDISTLRFSMYTLTGVVLVAGFIFAWHQADRFLIMNPRFVLKVHDDDSDDGIKLSGIHFASSERIQTVFQKDAGRSIYRFPIEERRRNLLAVPWVKDASVSRIWPNEIHVSVTERKPVAFALLPQSGPMPAMLVDEDGVFLNLHESGKFKLPVVRGLRTEQSEEDRKTRIRRFLRLQREIGEHIDHISEVDIANLDNLKITYPINNRAMILYLGHHHYASRLKKFLENADEIQRRWPTARALDLRLEDRITTVQDMEGVQRGG